MRRSFIIHVDSLDVLADLTDEQAGQLLKAMKAFHEDKENELSPLLKIAFSPFKNQFIRDNEKYLLTCKRRADAGSKGGVAKASKSKQMLANASKSKQNLANLADNDNKNDNKNDSDSKNDKYKYSESDLSIAHDFFNLILIINPKNKKPNFDVWADDIRKIREIDKREDHEIVRVIKWANSDRFWRTNILSPKKLREKWDMLVIQETAKNEGSKRNIDNSAPGRVRAANRARAIARGENPDDQYF